MTSTTAAIFLTQVLIRARVQVANFAKTMQALARPTFAIMHLGNPATIVAILH